MAKTKTPWWLCIKFYWFRLSVISMIWLLYNFSSYSFGLLSSQLLTNLLGDDSRLWVSFGWNTLLTFFYMPGCIAGSFLSDAIGPRKALGYSVLVQAVVGFIMSGCYQYLAQAKYAGGFVVIYGLFIALGELGPGDNIGLIASKTSATAVRGKYYGIAAAFGKIVSLSDLAHSRSQSADVDMQGAFIGSKTLILLYNKYYNAGEVIKAGQYPFIISSVFCVVNAALALFCLPHIGQETIEEEDARFKAYLEQNGYDVSKLGLAPSESVERFVDKDNSDAV
jgi:MFS family permease